MTRRVGGLLLHPCGDTMGWGTVYPEAVAPATIALPHTGAQPPLPIAISVPTRMPTADSFVGMPFMRPTLRMHCPSTLQRHTITGERQGRKVRAVEAGSPAPQSPQPSPAGQYVGFGAYAVFMRVAGGCKLLCARACVHCSLCAQPHICRCAQAYAVLMSP